MNRLLPLIVLALVLSACLPLPGPGPLTETTTPAPEAPTSTPLPAPTSEPPTALPTPAKPERPTPAAEISPGAQSITDTLAQLGSTSCPASEFTCVTLDMPLNHDASEPNGPIVPVVFGVLPASGIRKGMLVIAVGGPGSSGLSLADSYVAAYDSRLRERFDLVFFDQRGIGLSHGLQCPAAVADYYVSEGRPDTPEQEAAMLAAAETFARECVRQTRDSELLPFLSTRQAVEDLERFRQAMGVNRLWLYGESYGTQFAQTYAARHSEHVAGLVLDGVVDLTLDSTGYAAEATLAFEEILGQTLAACTADEACAADTGGNAAVAYDKLLATLAKGPATFPFPLTIGQMTTRTLTRSDLDTAVSSYLNAPDARLLMLRAVGSAAQGDWVALARLYYSSLGLDPDTLDLITDPSYSDAAYYGVTCLDYANATGAPQDRARAYLNAGRALLPKAPRMGAVFFSELPCAFWPDTSRIEPRPDALTADGITTLVLAATADPLTPLANGERVYRQLTDGYLIVTRGGAHVMFGRGNRCVDNPVTRFLVEGIPPDLREMTCDDVLADEYVAVAPADAKRFADPLAALRSLNDEIEHLPNYFYWDGAEPVTAGCSRGGAVSFEIRDVLVLFELESCAFSSGLAFTGTGEYNLDEDRFNLDVQVDGIAQGQLEYTRESDGSAKVTGTYGGKKVDLSK